jgi:hypothetical protein
MGNVNYIINYRPIANLCSSSKLKRILEILRENNVNITGASQHGFKRGRSTTTLSAKLQSIITRALDKDKYVLVANLNLSAAFNVVSIKLQIK